MAPLSSLPALWSKPWTSNADILAGPSDWTLIVRIGTKRFPEKSLQEISDMCISNPEVLNSFRKEHFDLPFYAFAKACASGTSKPGDIYAQKVKAKPKKATKELKESDDDILNAAIMENKQRAYIEAKRQDALKAQQQKALDDAKKARLKQQELDQHASKELAKEIRNCTEDYDKLRNFPKMCLIDTHKLPNKFAMFLYLQCIAVRESLMRAVVFCFAEWAKNADLPSYDIIRPFFQNRQLFDTVAPIKAMCKIIHVTRSILAASFGLRSRLVPKHFGEIQKTAFVYNIAAQNLYKDTYFREHSLSLLEAIKVLGPSEKLFNLYASVEQFESFYCGVDFPTFRLAFSLPEIEPPGILIKNASTTLDYLHAHLMSSFDPEDLGGSWKTYYDSLKPVYEVHKKMWDTNMRILGHWLDNSNDDYAMPTLESLNAPPDFLELFDLYFGTLRPECATKTITKTMNDLFDIINTSAFEIFSKQQDSLSMDEAVLNFLLSDGLKKWYSGYTYGPHMLHKFPFAPTLQERWLMTKHYKSNEMLRAKELLLVAEKYNLN